MDTTAHMTTARTKDLGFQMEARGIDADPEGLLLLAHTARELGVSEILVTLMIDEDEPEIARLRAFARVCIQVSMRQHESVPPTPSAPSTPSPRELEHVC